MVTELKNILRKSEELSKQMRKEMRICNAEREERLKLGLTGQAAIDHYNQFMIKNNLQNLII